MILRTHSLQWQHKISVNVLLAIRFLNRLALIFMRRLLTVPLKMLVKDLSRVIVEDIFLSFNYLFCTSKNYFTIEAFPIHYHDASKSLKSKNS